VQNNKFTDKSKIPAALFSASFIPTLSVS